MQNITLALDENVIKAGRQYARRHNMTLNALVRKLLAETVSSGSRDWTEECFALMDKARISPSAPRRWKREELHRG